MQDLTSEMVRFVGLRFVKSDPSLDDLLSLAILLKAAGLHKKEVVAEFEAARREIPEDDVELDDRYVEALDFVVGFCSSHARIFPDDDDEVTPDSMRSVL
ncbi:hypothetical protein [Luteolibacter sp. Populi]|uniref:hypothetical protein n=1 Tax=Luteolibacter sp. Populi TaxID=3230487 RepID=UPI0034661DA6